MIRLKLGVLAFAAVLLCCFNLHLPKGLAPNKQANSVQLLSDRIGRFIQTDQSWRIDRPDGSIEEGAMYVDPSSRPTPGARVQLDFYRAFNKRHNGLICYLLQGEVLRWTRVQTFGPPKALTRVVLGLTQSQDHLRLTAATECYTDHCDEFDLGSEWTLQLPEWSPLRHPGVDSSSRKHAVVPMSVVMLVETDPAHSASAEQELQERMEAFLNAFDFSSVQHLAALQ